MNTIDYFELIETNLLMERLVKVMSTETIIRNALDNAKAQNAKWCKHITIPKLSEDGLIDPADAHQYFRQCIYAVENGLVKMAQRFSPIQWLWYLRRFPHLHHIEENSFESYSLTLATILSAKAKIKKKSKQFDPKFGFPLDQATADYVLKFVAGVYDLADLHIKYGIAAREVPFQLNENHLPDPVFTKTKKQAGQIFDARTHGYDLTGSIPSQANKSQEELLYTIDKEYYPFFSRLPYFEFRGLETPRFVPTYHTTRPIYLTHISNLYRLTENGDGQWLTNEVFSLLILAGLLLPIAIGAPEHSINIAIYGYSMHKRRDFVEGYTPVFTELKSIIEQQLPNATLPESLLDLLNNMESLDTTLHPILPGVLLSDNYWIMIDHANIKSRLEKVLRFPTLGGKVGNQRGVYFEDAIQSYIDTSNWKPSKKLKSVRQVHLTRQSDSAQITDIDAIGEYGDTLLIISCKAVISTVGQDIGEYFALKNARIRLDDAVLKWQNVKAELTQFPIGENYDFSRYSKIIALVCTPNVVYTESELSLSDEVSGIRKAATAIEFVDWLNF